MGFLCETSHDPVFWATTHLEAAAVTTTFVLPLVYTGALYATDRRKKTKNELSTLFCIGTIGQSRNTTLQASNARSTWCKACITCMSDTYALIDDKAWGCFRWNLLQERFSGTFFDPVLEAHHKSYHAQGVLSCIWRSPEHESAFFFLFVWSRLLWSLCGWRFY